MTGSGISERQKQSAAGLKRALENARTIIDKSYLENLEALTAAPPGSEITDIDVTECGQFFHLKRLVTNKEENFLDKLVTVANAVAPMGCSLATIVESDGAGVNYYIGIVAKQARQDNEKDRALRMAGAEAFSGALAGNFSGSVLEGLDKEKTADLRRRMFGEASSGQTPKSVAAVSGVVSLRNSDAQGYVQGLENLTNSLRGKAYSIVMIADAADSLQIRTAKQGYEMLYTQLSIFKGASMSMNESESRTLSESHTEGITAGLSEGVSRSQFRSTGSSHTKGSNWGASATGSIGYPGIFGISLGASYGENASDTDSATEGSSTANNTQRSSGVNESDTKTTGSGSERGRSMQISSENRSVKSLMDKADMYMERLDACESFGAFECAAYVTADDRETAFAVAGHYNALMRGDASFVQSSHVNVWSPARRPKLKNEDSSAELVLQYLRAFSHPEFYLDAPDEAESVRVRPSSLVSGKELAVQFALPKKSVRGLPVLDMTPFGRNAQAPDDRAVKLGNLYYMGQDEPGRPDVLLNADSLTSHTFVTGSTGSGKSNTLYRMLDKLNGLGVKFMVVEPAKGEYKNVFGKRAAVWGTNGKKTPLLRLNPFVFPEEIHVLEHADRLVEVFNACWPMYAAMPAILKDAVETVYRRAGWDLRNSRCAARTFPILEDLLAELPGVIESSAFSKDTGSDYKGALLTRVKSLTTGIFGQIFCGEDVPGEELFDQNAIVDLSRVGSPETKALLMGLLVLKLQEYRMARADGSDARLRHVTVLEEAHHLLRRTSTEQSQEGANLQGKSVEMLANAIAEMRTYGEGFIIADQSPGLLDMSVIRNTNTKIILRLPDESDRQLAGKAAGLNGEQITELARLENFVAAVSQSDWPEPVLCKVAHFTDKEPFAYRASADEYTAIRKFAERVAGYTERLDLTDGEAEQLKLWRARLRFGKSALDCTDAVLRGETLDTLQGGKLLYILFNGGSLARQIQHTHEQEAVKLIDMEIADYFGYENVCEAVECIRNRLLRVVRELEGVNDTIRQRIERVLCVSPERGCM